MQSGQTLCKYGDCSNQQGIKIMPTGPLYSDNREDHSDNFPYDHLIVIAVKTTVRTVNSIMINVT